MSENSRQGQKTGGVGGIQQPHAPDDNLIAGKFTPQQIQNLRIIRAARRYNRDTHPDLAARFQAVTGLDPLAVAAIRAWQRAHGLKSDGKIGPETLRAAEQAAAQPGEGAAAASTPRGAAAGASHEAPAGEGPRAGAAPSTAVGAPGANLKAPPVPSGAEELAQAGEAPEEKASGDVKEASVEDGEGKQAGADLPGGKSDKEGDAPAHGVPLAEAYALLTPVLATDVLPGSDDAPAILARAGHQLFDGDGAIKADLLERNPAAKKALTFLREPGATWQSNVEQTVAAFKSLVQPLIQAPVASKRPAAGAAAKVEKQPDALADKAAAAGPGAGSPTPQVSPTTAAEAPTTPAAAHSVDAGKPQIPGGAPKEALSGGEAEASKIEAVDPHPKPEKVAAENQQQDEKNPEDKDGDGLAAVEDHPTVVIESQVHVDEFFAKVPNNDKKKHAYKALLDAHKSVAKAEASVHKATSAAAKTAAEQKLAAAQQQLDSVKAQIVPMVANALVNSDSEVIESEKLLRSTKEKLGAATKKKDKHKIATLKDQVTSMTTDLKALKAQLYPQKLAEAQVMKHDDADDVSVLDPVETEVTHHDFAFPDKEHVKVRDHVAAYATTVKIGLDNESAGRDKDRPHSDVKGRMKEAGLSESKQKILGAISGFEGEFDTLNTYDRAILTWGFVQWTGGQESDLTTAMTIIKQQYPDGFARAFQKYGIDIEGKKLIVTMPDGSGRLEGSEAAEAIMRNPKLGAAMVHAGRDPDVQKGEVKAAESIEIDNAMGTTVEVGGQAMAAHQLLTSEYAVGLLANTFVHSGRATASLAMRKAVDEVVSEHPYVAGDDAWAIKAEAAIIKQLEGTDGDRAGVLKKKLSRDRGTYQP